MAYTTTRAPGEAFIPLAVRAGRDLRLTLAAKGLLWELLTYHDDELPADEDIYRAHRSAREAEGLKPDGKPTILASLKELETRGYLVRLHVYDETGNRRSVRALTDSPGHHKLDIKRIFDEAAQISGKADRLAAQRVLLIQQKFPRGAHSPAAESTQAGNVVSLDGHRLRRAG